MISWWAEPRPLGQGVPPGDELGLDVLGDDLGSDAARGRRDAGIRRCSSPRTSTPSGEVSKDLDDDVARCVVSEQDLAIIHRTSSRVEMS